MDQYSEILFDLYVQCEKNMERLYLEFARLFPEEADFWNLMALEEMNHAGWIAKLAKAVAEGKVEFAEGKVKTYTLKTFIQYQEGLIKSAKQEKIDIKRAVNVALDMEKSLIEKEVFAHFAGDNAEKNNLLDRLGKATAKHAARLDEMRLKYL